MSTRRYFRILLSLSVFLILTCFWSCVKENDSEEIKVFHKNAFVFQGIPTSPITFLSTQMNPVEEAGKMRNVILKDFPGVVDFRPNDSSFLSAQVESTLKGNPSASILLGALHGDLVTMAEKNELQSVDSIYGKLEARDFFEDLLELTQLNKKEMYYIPWMQASFVMVANKKALAYLPAETNLDELSYEQLELWTKNIYDQTGMKAMGFPAGEKGLMHRFFQGYLYPSFTASTLVKFRGDDAIGMWEYFRALWQYVTPGSLVYSTMSDPLIAEDVWIAWDHTARLLKVFENRPDDFIAFPAPIGPKGRGYMPVISGLAIPRNTTDIQNSSLLIDYLTQEVIQSRVLAETGFFPVLNSLADSNVPESFRALNSAIQKQANSKNSVLTLLPIGLGERGGEFNTFYMLTFSEIVLDGKDIQIVLDTNADELQKILTEENASCWLPDTVEGGRPCEIE